MERLLHPPLGCGSCAGSTVGCARRGRDGQDDDRNFSGRGRVFEALQRFPAGQAWHGQVEQNGLDGVGGGERDRLLSGLGLEDAVAVLAQVFTDHGANVGIVVAEQDAALAGRGEGFSASETRESDEERGSGAAVMGGVRLRPDMTIVLGDDGAANGKAEAGAAFLAGVRGFHLAEAFEDGVELVERDAAALVGRPAG